MKKGLAWLLAIVMSLSACLAMAEAPAEGEQADGAVASAVVSNYEELTVGATTAMSGLFFTDMWGDNTADMDVRALLHGYNLIQWNGGTGTYAMDDSVVSGLVVTDDAEGNRTYTMSLYEDMTYSDGTPITARDYAFSILFSVAPEAAQLGAAINGANYILGIDEYKRGEAQTIAGVRVLGDYQLAVTIRGEYLPFFYELALLDYNPYPIHVIAPGCEVADDGQGVYIRNSDENVTEPIFTAELLRETVLNEQTGYRSHPSVVSGPYTLTDYDAAASVAKFEINPAYKGNAYGEKPQIQRLIFRHVSNDEAIDLLANGEIGLINKCVNADTLDAGMQLVTDGTAGVSNYARSGFSFVSFACERPATDSAAVRQAIAHCMDKDALIADYVRNYGLSVDGYYGIGQWTYQLAAGSLAPTLEEPAADADAETVAAYEEEAAAWEALSMDGMTRYALDLDEAARLLAEDGWTLNRDGNAFDPEKDDVRCKNMDGSLVALDLTLIYPEGNAVGEYFRGAFAQNLAAIGVKLTVQPKPFDELLRVYYRQQERDCDMIYLASNFANVFEPSATFSPDDAYQGTDNRTGIVDETLYQLAVAMRQTEPGDVLSYCQKWVAFQERWTELLPAIPVYSNVYFDFYAPTLHNYNAGANVSWAQAIVSAYLGDAVETEEETLDEGEMEFTE